MASQPVHKDRQEEGLLVVLSLCVEYPPTGASFMRCLYHMQIAWNNMAKQKQWGEERH